MKTLLRLVFAFGSASAFTAISALGGQFEFSYVFNSGHVVSGTFSGTQAGNFVINAADFTLAFDGVDTGLATGVVATQYTGNYYVSGSYVTPPLISFDFSQTNLNYDGLGNGGVGYSVQLVGNGGGGSYAGAGSGTAWDGLGNQFDLPPHGDRWSLQAVPDSGMTATLLGAVLVGLAALRRRFGCSSFSPPLCW